MFRRKQAVVEGLSSTKTALIQPIKRAHFQCIIWFNETVAYRNIPSPSEYGWRKKAGVFSPVMTTMDPEAILHLVTCGCTSKTKCTTLSCQCKSNTQFCIKLCTCGTEDESCNNIMLHDETIDEDPLTDDM